MFNKLSTYFERWEKDKETDFELDSFIQSFQNIRKITNLAKLKSFQIRLLHRAIILNDKLFLWKVTDGKICSNCHETESTENIHHFFWQCAEAQKIWKSTEEICREKVQDEIVISYENIILNQVNAKPKHILNFIILLVKQMMYAFRCQGKKLTKTNIIQAIEICKNYELYYAKQQHKIEQQEMVYC